MSLASKPINLAGLHLEAKMSTAAIEAVLLDFDNTLFNSLNSYFTALNESLSRQGLPRLSWKTFLHLVRVSESNVSLRRSLPQVLRALKRHVSEEEVEKVIECYKEVFPAVDVDLTYAPPSRLRALQSLASRFKIGIVTARPTKEGVEALLRKFNVSELVEVIVTARDAPSIKPSVDQLLIAVERLRVEPAKCVMVGDSPRDVEAGRRAGMLTIGVASGVWSRRELMMAGAHVVVDDLAEVAEKLLSERGFSSPWAAALR
ncbi:MAG: hypothetical protein DRJ69_03150 [Thermoprotei archaeon]|nr:MAG: hypothetical protein DRJ69_03150 [Thermoprotei archaeon]